MRLWHRIFVCMIGIFLLGFAIFAPSIVKRNFSNDLQREQERLNHWNENQNGNQIYFIQKRLQEGRRIEKKRLGGWQKKNLDARSDIYTIKMNSVSITAHP